MDFQKFIDELKSKNDIVDVISGYLPVIQRGRNYWTACPFHHEKTPSFSISRQGQFYKCFGCGVSGDVIKFVEEYEGVSFMEAVQILAARAGLSVPAAADEKAEKDIRLKRKKREVLLQLLKETALFYHRVLLSESGRRWREYLAKRGISEKTCKAFGIGCSSDRETLVSYLADKGFSAENMLAAGVAETTRRGQLSDAMAGRLIIPVIGGMREVLAFGGRAYPGNDSFAKYKNTSQTVIFDKSNTLFNINKLKELKQKGQMQRPVLVEGYMDVIALHEYGYPCAVASMGTSLTAGQARMLKRYTDEIYICYDGDSAGRGATLRGLDILRAEGLRVNVMSLPDKTDPDEFIREHGAEAFSELVRGARELNDYKLYVLMSKYDLSEQNPSERERNRIAFTKEALDVIRSTEDSVEKEKLVEKVVFTTGFNEEFVRNNSVREENESFVIPQAGADGYTLALACVAAAMIEGVEYAEDYYPAVKAGSSAGKIFSYIKECRERSEKPEMNRLFQETGEADPLVMAIVGTEFDGKPSEKAYYTDCLKKVKSADIDGEIMQLSKYAEKASEDELPAYTARIRALMNKKKNISGSR